MSTFAVAALGSLVTIGAAIIARLTLVPTEIRANDRRVLDRDDDLETWICDRDVSLRRELRETREKLNADNLLYSGEYIFRIGLAKERALHEWRDQDRQALRDVATIYDRENLLHRGWRWIGRRRRLTLETPTNAKPVLDAWRTPPTAPGMGGGPAAAIDDPTERTLRRAIDAARKIGDYQ